MQFRIKTVIVFFFMLVLFSGCHKDDSNITQNKTKTGGLILSAKIVQPVKKIPSFGDLWLSTWAEDNNIYMSWGDGTGPGTCYPVPDGVTGLDSALVISSCEDNPVIAFCDDFCEVFSCDGVTPYSPCVITQAGLFKLTGNIVEFQGCEKAECIQSIHIPTGVPQFKFNTDPTQRRGDKPSSLLALNNKIYWFGHQLTIEPKYGYVAVSVDHGKTWNEIPNSPWQGNSNFRIMMAINMGKNFNLSKDDYVYLLGINGELNWPPESQKVYLARVPKNKIADYSSYEYLNRIENENKPGWSGDQDSAVALPDLSTISLGAAIYHEGVQKYLFLAVPDYPDGPALTLYFADKPWGPWKTAQKFEGEVYIPGIITKNTGPNSFYFTAAGGGGVGNTYQLTIAKIEMNIGN